MKKKVIICIVLLIVVIAGAIMLIGNTGSDKEAGTNMSDYNKVVTEFTWEEFNELKPSEQIKFQDSFDSDMAFEAWMEKAQGIEEDNVPWEEGGKQPNEYTWQEFNDLSKANQIKFQESFKNIDEFDKWLQKAQKDAE